MTKNLDQLRQAAERATPGPWAVYDRGIGYEVHDANGYELNGGMRETFTEADATHIATFDPPTVLALIDRVEAAEQAVERAKAADALQRRDKGALYRRAEVAEGRLSAVGLVVDDLHATGAISQDAADQLTEALDGGEQE